MNLEGIYIPSVTPFTNVGELNLEVLSRLIEYWASTGVSGLIPNASTSEGPFLNRYERLKVISYMIEKAEGRFQVFAGTGALGTRETIINTKEAYDIGAQAALITSPFFFKPSDKEIFQYFSDILSKVDMPVILYNVPKFTGYSVNPMTVNLISDEHSNLIGIKDSSGNPGSMAETIRLCGKKISCMSGAADMILPTLMLGGKGAVIAVANVIPDVCVKLYKAFISKDISKASQYQLTASYVNKILVKENPQIASIKEALNQRDFNVGIPRRPLLPLKESTGELIREALMREFPSKGKA
jgi:4-hydroxy-tetrahydrodipicolinate synthase